MSVWAQLRSAVLVGQMTYLDKRNLKLKSQLLVNRTLQ